jgi:hypothetical protein
VLLNSSKQGPRRRPALSRAAWALLAIAVAFTVFVAVKVATDDGKRAFAPGVAETPVKVAPGVPKGEQGERSEKAFDPLAFDPDGAEDLERRAAAAFSHPLYVLTQGGATAGAPRTARWRRKVEAAAQGSGFDPDVVEAIVFLESSGRPDVYALGDVENASGLTQIVAGTGQGLLAMRVDVGQSRSLTKRIARAESKGKARTAARLKTKRRRVDERFDPRKALAGTIRYLTAARKVFGRDDLAVVSYHMGIGNLEGAIRDYADDRTTPVKELVADKDISYTRLFFDTSPLRDADAYATLTGLSDDSITYYWRILAAKEIMRLYRDEPDRLARLQDLQDNKASAEEVLQPPGSTERFREPGDILAAIDDEKLRPLPTRGTRKLGFVLDRQMGELAKRLEQKPSTYRALRPEALALLVYLSAGMKAIAPRSIPLRVTSTVRDVRYQGLLLKRVAEATSGYSLHTTGYAFDVLRDYRDKRQADAFQFMLDRPEALDLIAWIREPAAIHITVSHKAKSLLGLLDRLPDEGG